MISAENFLALKSEDRQAFTKVLMPEKQLSYWQQTWEKLKNNIRAMLSLYCIIGLVLFSTLGPFLWKIDPAYQDLNQISQAPAFKKTAIIIDAESWKPQPVNTNSFIGKEILSNLRLLEDSVAHTESVKLLWQADTRASYYEIYRHDLKPSGEQDLGLPLAKIDNYLQNYYEDKLKLEERDYYYSVLARNHANDILAIETLKIKPMHAVLRSQAQKNIKKGLWKASSNKRLADEIILPAHPMGTDYLGRDIMARLMWGGQTSLLISVLASIFFVALGSLYGAVSAYIGGRVDNILMRFADFMIALPFLLFMILLKVSFGLGAGESGIGVMILSLIILSWPSAARLVRAQVLVLREQNFVLVARINGASLFYVVSKHLLPNTLSIIFVCLSFAIPSVILTEAFLSFIGLGVVPPTPSWGSMCQDGIKNFLFHPHELIFPASFIGITVLAFNLLGDGLRDALDVKAEIS